MTLRTAWTIWTVWLDYFATGEGRTCMACIAYADSAEHAREGFARLYGAYYAEGAVVDAGVVRNRVTQLLFSTQVLDAVQSLSGEAAITLNGHFHFNRA